MIQPNHPNIRRLLRRHNDGLTTSQISGTLGINRDSAYRALRNMPDTYIDRWTEAKLREPSEAIWCAIVPPRDCPKPVKKPIKRKEMNGHAEFRSLVQ
jgi:hypothetical protein